MSSPLKVKKTTRTLPVRTSQTDVLVDNASIDTRTTEQKTKSQALCQRTLSMNDESLTILTELTDLTGRSQRDILTVLNKQALDIMKVKMEFARSHKMVPTLDIT
ncbi:MAG: hypothetical protein ACI936_001360 [Paraglaciecola sp.]|jgi:hypothetical protein